MNKLRLEFEGKQKSKFNGTKLLFETSNNKYIEWLEQKLVNKKEIIKFSDFLKQKCTNSSRALWIENVTNKYIKSLKEPGEANKTKYCKCKVPDIFFNLEKNKEWCFKCDKEY